MRLYVVTLLLTSTIRIVQAQDEPRPGAWKEDAVSAKLSNQAITHLEKEKVLMTQAPLIQCYQAYLPSWQWRSSENEKNLPWFITSDALFHAYAACVQKSVSNMEQAHAEQLRIYLETMLRKLGKPWTPSIDGDAALLQNATEHALFVMGVAARLMEVKETISPATLQDEIEEVTARIQAAQGSVMIKKLGMTTRSSRPLDFTLFKPSGFYTDTLDLSRYFQAVRWLQLAPFYLNDEEGVLAASLLSLLHVEGLKAKKTAEAAIYTAFQKRDERLCGLAGPAIHPVLFNCMQGFPDSAPRNTSALITHARTYLSKEVETLSTQHITSTAEPLTAFAAYAVSSSRLADAALIEVLSLQKDVAYFPDTLCIPSWLGCRFATSEMDAKPETASLIDQADDLLAPARSDFSLHTSSLQLLQKLFATPAPNAPTFMKSRAWQAKSCQTALSAWTQSRHIWTLQARPQSRPSAGFRRWPAFVEPLPYFFSGLASLCTEAANRLEFLDSAQTSNKRIAGQIRTLVKKLDPKIAEPKNSNEEQPTQTFVLRMTAIDFLPDKETELIFEDSLEAQTKLIRTLNECADLIEAGRIGTKYPDLKKKLDSMVVDEVPPFLELAKTCKQLALIATRQMRGEPPSEDDAGWLEVFGPRLAILTGCNFALSPDNVPKCARIVTNEKLNKTLHAGIGRPSFLYVLYPWKGEEILCRGAVLPYLESHQPGTITDEEWRQSLDKPDRIMHAPAWIKALTGE